LVLELEFNLCIITTATANRKTRSIGLLKSDYCFESVPPLTITDPVGYFEEMLEKATHPAIRRCIQAAVDAAKSGVDTTGMVIVDGKLIRIQDSMQPGMGLIFLPNPIVSVPINFSLR
jgi:hypothetical protein